jgi:hypothetical protein
VAAGNCIGCRFEAAIERPVARFFDAVPCLEVVLTCEHIARNAQRVLVIDDFAECERSTRR